MKRSLFVVAVVLLAALTAFAPVASAQNVSGSLEVASKNTTDSDFQNATLNNFSVSNGAVTHTSNAESWSAVDEVSGTQTVSDRRGIKVTAVEDIPQLEIEIHPQVTATKAHLIRVSDDAVLASADISNDKATLDAPLNAGTDYWLAVDADGNDYTAVNDNSGEPGDQSGALEILGGGPVGLANDGITVNIETVSIPSTPQATYVGANHSVGGAESGFVNISEASNTDVTVTWEAHDGSSWTTLDQQTYTTAGNKTAPLSPGYDKYRVDIQSNNQSGATTYQTTIESEGILFDAEAPTIDNSSASPTGGLDKASQTLSLNVSDADFSLAQGDSVNVTFEARAPNESSFSTVGSETLTSNGTANTSLQADVGGTWEWRATATDSYGESATSQTFEFSAPGTLFIRNETTPQNLINVSGGATATVTFFGSENVVERPINNGTVDLTGLPADERFVAVIDADGYYSRRIVIPSIYEQETAYLLPDNASAANIVFKLDDSTGNFDPEETTLFIEKAITRNNSTEYRVVAADEFGASGEFAVDLLDDTRYRLRVKNQEGDQRVLGSYTTSGDALATVPIGDVAIGEDYDGGAAIQTNLISSDGYQYVKVSYVDSENATDELTLGVELENGTVVRPNTTETISGDVYSETINVSSYPDDATYKVYYSANRSGETISGTDTLNGVNSPLAGVPLDPQVASIGSWVGILAVGGLIGIASGPFGALAMVIVATLFVILGTVGIPSLLLTIAGAVAILSRIGDRQ